MKKLIFIVFMACVSPINAETWSIVMDEKIMLAGDDMYSVGAWHGIQLSYAPNDKGYFFISHEKMEVLTTGTAFDYYLQGFGVGNSVKLSESFTAYGQLGYYFIKNSIGSRRNYENNESLSYYMYRRYDFAVDSYEGRFDAFSIGNKNTIAGTIGLKMHYPISKGWSADFDVSYRMLKIDQEINAYRNHWVGSHKWVAENIINYSSINYGFGLTYTF